MERMPIDRGPIDPTLPTFHFSESEKKEMREKKNMTDDQILAKETEITNRQAQNQFRQERKNLAA